MSAGVSHAYYATRLIWQGTRGGIAKLHGRVVQLTAAPEIHDLRIVAIDYVPEIGLRQVMPFGHGWRDMTDEEVRAADRVLAALCGG